MDHRRQAPREDRCVADPLGRVLGQEIDQDRLEFLGDAGGVLADRQRHLGPLLLEHLNERVGDQRRPVRQDRIEDTPQAVQVGPGADGAGVGLLGRHEVGRPEHVAGGRQPRLAEQAGDAEVGELDRAVVGDQQVGGLDVAVDHAAIVGVLQRGADCDAHFGRFAPVEVPAGQQFVLQAASVDVFHRVEQPPFLLAESEQTDDVRMVQLAKRFDFHFESLAEPRIVVEAGRQDLDRHRLLGLQVDALVDHSHPTPPERSQDAVGAELVRSFLGIRFRHAWFRAELVGANQRARTLEVVLPGWLRRETRSGPPRGGQRSAWKIENASGPARGDPRLFMVTPSGRVGQPPENAD